MIPTTRQQFSQFVMRKLGAPVVQINISEEQADDIIDQALYYFAENHSSGFNKTFFAYQLTPTDITNKYIPMPANIIGVVRMFPLGAAISSDALFNMRYQFIMNDLYSLTNVSLVPYYMTMQHIALLEEILVGQQPLRYNRHENICYIDMDWTVPQPGQFIVLEAYYAVNTADTWKDRWLQDYTEALMGRQWGRNLKKMKVVLPSGMTISGKEIYDDYNVEVRRLEDSCLRDYGEPLQVFMG